MNRRILLTVVALVFLLLIMGSCRRASKSMILTESDAGKTAEMSIGDELAITLVGNPSTGYGWEVVPVEGAVLEPVGEPEFEADSDLVGAPGKITLHFKAIRAGQQTLRLIYRRPWEEQAEPLETFEVTVIVNGDQ